MPFANARKEEHAVTDAIVAYSNAPHRYDPSRTSLESYVEMMASRRLIDEWRSVKRRGARENIYARETAARTLADVDSDKSLIVAALRECVLKNSPDAERIAVELWLDGERGTASLARALGLSDASVATQRIEAKRFKDRALKRLARCSVVTEGMRSHASTSHHNH